MSDSVRKNVAENYKLKPSMIKSKKTSHKKKELTNISIKPN